jgi:hypothetical protein
MEDRPAIRPSPTQYNTDVRYTSVPRAECEPPIAVLERSKAVQDISLLHTEPPYCVLKLYCTLFSASFVLRFSTNNKDEEASR